MRKIVNSKRLKENMRMSMAAIGCVLMIVFLTVSCAGEYKKQTSSYSNETGHESVTGESENAKTNDDQEIECRYKAYTGSRFKRKTCLTKAQWAVIDNERRKNADAFLRDADQKTGVYTGSDIGGMGGQTTGQPR